MLSFKDTQILRGIMETIDFLEKMANYTHYDVQISKLISTQSSAVKSAIILNDSEALRMQMSPAGLFANDCDVVNA